MSSKFSLVSTQLYKSIKHRSIRAIRILTFSYRKPSSRIDNSIYEASNNSDISEHLHLLNFLVRFKNPEVLVELGTRGGESTRVFLKALQELGGTGYSVDLDLAPQFVQQKVFWTHFVEDDIRIGKSISTKHSWPNGDGFIGIDFLFLDTSHEYEHTLAEIDTWWPLLNKGALMVFHDTNLSDNPSKLLSGGFTRGWNNQRGVSRAIEEYFSINFDENSLTVLGHSSKISNSLHLPWCNGLSIIQKTG